MYRRTVALRLRPDYPAGCTQEESPLLENYRILHSGFMYAFVSNVPTNHHSGLTSSYLTPRGQGPEGLPEGYCMPAYKDGTHVPRAIRSITSRSRCQWLVQELFVDETWTLMVDSLLDEYWFPHHREPSSLNVPVYTAHTDCSAATTSKNDVTVLTRSTIILWLIP